VMVDRAINGTEAAEHAGSPVSVFKCAGGINEACLYFLTNRWGTRANPNLVQFRVGDYEERYRHSDRFEGERVQVLRNYVRRVAG